MPGSPARGILRPQKFFKPAAGIVTPPQEAPAVVVVVETGSAAFPFVSPRLRRRPNIVPRQHPPLREVEPIRRILPIAADTPAAIPNDDPEVIIALYAMGEINESEMAALLAVA